MSDEDDGIGTVTLVASGLFLVGLPLVFTLFAYTGLSSQVLPLVCDPAVDLDATAVEGPPADAEHVFGDDAPYADQWIQVAADQGIYRRCSTEAAVEFRDLVQYGPLETRDTFYYRDGNQWYRIESHVVDDGPPF